jgi:cytochrome c oxidase subunit 1
LRCFPSLLTFFNVVARWKSPDERVVALACSLVRQAALGDPVVVAQVLAMLLFAFGGIGGLVNASYSLNLIVHNTMYIVGHFHLTVGTAVTLSFMGITYWLVPVLRGRGLWSRRLALTQTWLWFVGMTMFSFALHDLGMLGMPRRTMISLATYIQPSWRGIMPFVAVGGSIMFLSAMLYFLNLLMTCIASRQPAPEPPAFAEALSGPEEAPAFLDRWRPWLVLTAVFIIVAYGHTLWHLVSDTPMNVPGMRVW